MDKMEELKKKKIVAEIRQSDALANVCANNERFMSEQRHFILGLIE